MIVVYTLIFLRRIRSFDRLSKISEGGKKKKAPADGEGGGEVAAVAQQVSVPGVGSF